MDEEQTAVLKDAAENKDIKVMALVGSTGCGKTILATEVTKIWMAQEMEKQQSVCKSIHYHIHQKHRDNQSKMQIRDFLCFK